jgi:serine/threonine protein phosphatase PrpC
VPSHPDRNKIFSCLGGMAEPVIDLSKRTPLFDGDILILCTDGLWSVYPHGEMATMLTSTPILTTAPRIMREAEVRGGAEGDNLSAIIVRWGAETLADEPTTTDNLELGQFETQVENTVTLADRAGAQRDLSDDEIERAIAEIQSTIQKYRK